MGWVGWDGMRDGGKVCCTYGGYLGGWGFKTDYGIPVHTVEIRV